MTMEQKIALETLQKIQSLLLEAGMTTDAPRATTPGASQKELKPIDAVALLTRVQGIIKNFNEENATEKLKNLIALVSALHGRF